MNSLPAGFSYPILIPYHLFTSYYCDARDPVPYMKPEIIPESFICSRILSGNGMIHPVPTPAPSLMESKEKARDHYPIKE